jgi:hypothetical protein
MKKLVILLVATAGLLSSCTVKQTLTSKDGKQPNQDLVYVRMTDVFYLRPGMTYEEVKSILAVDPYELYQNIQDNSVILRYHGKRNMRYHVGKTEPVPLEFIPSQNPKHLALDGNIAVYLILDGKDRVLKSVFTDPDPSEVKRFHFLLQRSELMCTNPEAARKYVARWTGQSNTTSAVAVIDAQSAGTKPAPLTRKEKLKAALEQRFAGRSK